MTLQETRERRLRRDGVESLTLSACDTAMGGGRNENGAEVEFFFGRWRGGRGRGGAGDVVAVVDASTEC